MSGPQSDALDSRARYRDHLLCALVPHAVHRLGNLLTVVMGAADLLAMEETRPDRATDLDGISSQARRAVQLIHALGGHARTQPVPPVAVDLGESVRALSELMSPVAKAVGLPLVIDASSGLTVARVDPGGLQLALVGILVEALHPEGGLAGRDGATHMRAVETGTRAHIAIRIHVLSGDPLEPFVPSEYARGLIDQLGATLRFRSTPDGNGLGILLSLPVLS